MKDVHEALQLPACIRKKKWDCRNIPGIFTDRILKLCILSFSILLPGCFMGIQTESPKFVFWSVILGIAVFVRAVLLLHTAMTGTYETVEGVVLLITGKSPVGKFRKINLNYSRSNKEVSGYRFFDISKQNHPTHTGIALKMGIKSLSCS